jgi:uncharacterized SAM-binding protein YcdF (DUF218 family)
MTGKGRRVASLGILVLVAVAAWLGLPYLGRFLVVREKPVRSDVIIVLGGGDQGRIREAVTLWRQGVAPRLLLSGGAPAVPGLSQAQLMARQAEHMGVPRADLLLETRSLTTLQNALFTLPIMERQGFRSAVVVSSSWHMRRASWLFGSVYQGSGIRLTFTPAPDPYYRPSRWYLSATDAVLTVSEYVKLLINGLQIWLR